MKKLFYFVFIMMLTIYAQAQNVGIGTTTPAAKLDVKTSSSYVSQLNGGSSMYSGIFENDIYRGYWGSYSGNPEDVDFGTGAGNLTGKLHFTIQAIPRLSINATGNVGVGTVNPLAKFEIGNIGTGDAFKITHRPGTLNSITSIDNNGLLYHEGGAWIHSGFGQIRFGFPSSGWALGTINGGQDLQLWSYNPDFATQTARVFMDGTTGNLGLGIGNNSPDYRFQVEAGDQTGIHARSTVNKTDSAAIMAVLDVPAGADFRVSAIRGESKSTTSNSIGVYGLQNGGGFGVAGSVKEAGLSGWGAGVFGEAGLKGFASGTGGYGVYGLNHNSAGTAGFFSNIAADVNSRALKTSGRIQLTGISEGAGKILTSDALGNATWDDITGTHNHLGENWTGGAATIGLTIDNSSGVSSATAFSAIASGGGSNVSYGVRGSANSAVGIGVSGVNNQGVYAPSIANAGVSGSAGTGHGVAGTSLSGYCFYGLKVNSPSHINSVARFENQNAANTSPVVQVVATGSQPALELNNGYIKVSGTNKTVFTATSTAGNISANQLRLSYADMASTDILIVTHRYNSAYVGAVGTWWNGSQWTIFREDLAAMPIGEAFNVFIVKQ